MAIIVTPLAKAREVSLARRPSHVVSLLDPDTPFPVIDDAHHLRLGVHDILDDQPDHIAPAQAHVRAILSFVSGWERAAPILIHCYAGISRSTATAFVTACVHNPRADEEEIALALRRASRVAWPNRRIVALADAELGRGGRMLKAIEAIGPGKSWHEHGDNIPFEVASLFEVAP